MQRMLSFTRTSNHFCCRTNRSGVIQKEIISCTYFAKDYESRLSPYLKVRNLNLLSEPYRQKYISNSFLSHLLYSKLRFWSSHPRLLASSIIIDTTLQTKSIFIRNHPISLMSFSSKKKLTAFQMPICKGGLLHFLLSGGVKSICLLSLTIIT